LESNNPKYGIANTHVQVEYLPEASCGGAITSKMKDSNKYEIMKFL
jgi:hypothetical protein